MKDFAGSDALVSSVELAQIAGVELETINNWIRRGIIRRSRIGGRQLRNRLFSVDEIYKTALKNELVKLGIQPSSANEAVDQLWKIEKITELVRGKDIYVALSKTGDGWFAFLFRAKSSTTSFSVHPQFSEIKNFNPFNQPCVLIPLSNIFSRIERNLSNVLGDKSKDQKTLK